MASSINTSGFGVNLMPQLPAVDPSLYAANPQAITGGFMQALQALGSMEELKAERARQAELAATRDARLAQIKAMSDLQVLAAGKQGKLQGSEIEAALAGLGLATAKSKGELKDLPDVRLTDQMRRNLDKMSISSTMASMGQDKALANRLKEAQIAESEATAVKYLAEAERLNAEARSRGLEPSKAMLAWENGLANLAVDVGKTPEQMRELYLSQAVSKEKGIPLSTELASIAKISPQFYEDISKAMSPELKAWLGNDGLAALERRVKLQESEEAPSGPAHIVVDPITGVIKRTGSASEVVEPAKGAAVKEQPKQDKKTASSGRPILEAIREYGPSALLIASKAKEGVTSGLGSEASRKIAAMGRLAGAKGGALARGAISGARAIPRLAGAAAVPVAALDIANTAIGKAQSDEFTGDLTALEAIAMATQAPKFDEMLNDARIDAIGQRIQMVINSGLLDEEVKVQELTKLLEARDALLNPKEKERKTKRRLMPAPLLSM